MNGASYAWTTSSKTFGSIKRFANALWTGETPETTEPETEPPRVSQPIPDGLSSVENEEESDDIGADPWKRFSLLWGHYPEIFNEVRCSVFVRLTRQTVTEYFSAENQGAVGQGQLPEA